MRTDEHFQLAVFGIAASHCNTSSSRPEFLAAASYARPAMVLPWAEGGVCDRSYCSTSKRPYSAAASTMIVHTHQHAAQPWTTTTTTRRCSCLPAPSPMQNAVQVASNSSRYTNSSTSSIPRMAIAVRGGAKPLQGFQMAKSRSDSTPVFSDIRFVVFFLFSPDDCFSRCIRRCHCLRVATGSVCGTPGFEIDDDGSHPPHTEHGQQQPAEKKVHKKNSSFEYILVAQTIRDDG